MDFSELGNKLDACIKLKEQKDCMQGLREIFPELLQATDAKDFIMKTYIPKKFAKKKMYIKLNALLLTDLIVHKFNEDFRAEVFSKTFLNLLVFLLKNPDVPDEVKERIVILFKKWNTKFSGQYPILVKLCQALSKMYPQILDGAAPPSAQVAQPQPQSSPLDSSSGRSSDVSSSNSNSIEKKHRRKRRKKPEPYQEPQQELPKPRQRPSQKPAAPRVQKRDKLMKKYSKEIELFDLLKENMGLTTSLLEGGDLSGMEEMVVECLSTLQSKQDKLQNMLMTVDNEDIINRAITLNEDINNLTNIVNKAVQGKGVSKFVASPDILEQFEGGPEPVEEQEMRLNDMNLSPEVKNSVGQERQRQIKRSKEKHRKKKVQVVEEVQEKPVAAVSGGGGGLDDLLGLDFGSSAPVQQPPPISQPVVPQSQAPVPAPAGGGLDDLLGGFQPSPVKAPQPQPQQPQQLIGGGGGGLDDLLGGPSQQPVVQQHPPMEHPQPQPIQQPQFNFDQPQPPAQQPPQANTDPFGNLMNEQPQPVQNNQNGFEFGGLANNPVGVQQMQPPQQPQISDIFANASPQQPQAPQPQAQVPQNNGFGFNMNPGQQEQQIPQQNGFNFDQPIDHARPQSFAFGQNDAPSQTFDCPNIPLKRKNNPFANKMANQFQTGMPSGGAQMPNLGGSFKMNGGGAANPMAGFAQQPEPMSNPMQQQPQPQMEQQQQPNAFQFSTMAPQQPQVQQQPQAQMQAPAQQQEPDPFGSLLSF